MREDTLHALRRRWQELRSSAAEEAYVAALHARLGAVPDDAAARLLLGELHLAAGRLALAAAEYERGRSSEEHEAEARLGLASCHIKAKALKSALAELRRAQGSRCTRRGPGRRSPT
ncbi:MAG: tetratricopeptide repeat protein [Planctomycetota bacterium]